MGSSRNPSAARAAVSREYWLGRRAAVGPRVPRPDVSGTFGVEIRDRPEGAAGREEYRGEDIVGDYDMRARITFECARRARAPIRAAAIERIAAAGQQIVADG